VSCAYKGKEGKELLKYCKIDEKEGLVEGFFTAPGAYFEKHYTALKIVASSILPTCSLRRNGCTGAYSGQHLQHDVGQDGKQYLTPLAARFALFDVVITPSGQVPLRHFK
jgi:hypothetical protein